jgi:hypothetical protein
MVLAGMHVGGDLKMSFAQIQGNFICGADADRQTEIGGGLMMSDGKAGQVQLNWLMYQGPGQFPVCSVERVLLEM